MNNIEERYLKGYITDKQLSRYVELNIITKKEEKEIKEKKVKNKK